MSKYSYEFKKKLVKEYLAGTETSCSLAKKYGLKYPSYICEWVKAYQELGDMGLQRRPAQERKYSFEEKLSVVELYMTSNLTMREIALQRGLPTKGVISEWARLYRAGGPEALKGQGKGKQKTMYSYDDKGINYPKHKNDSSDDYVKELEAELHKLRIENAFLKEQRRLRLEDEAKMRERRGSSTVSEDSSN